MCVCRKNGTTIPVDLVFCCNAGTGTNGQRIDAFEIPSLTQESVRYVNGQSDECKNLILVGKHWRDSWGDEWGDFGGKPSSYLVELLMIEAFKKTFHPKKSYCGTFCEFLRMITDWDSIQVCGE